MGDITFTVITNNNGRLLTKTISPDGNSGIVKKSAAYLADGTAKTVQMPFADFGPFLRSLSPNQAIIHSVCGHDSINIVSAANYRGQANTITRSLEHFYYPGGPGLGMFDHDPKPGQQALGPDEFISIICKVWPEFQSIPKWWTPSTSSCIYDLEGNELTGEGNGFHLYFVFNPASELPEFSKSLFKRLWCSDHGYIFVSKAGASLPRTIFDASVFSPERLDFVAGANCIDCEQRLPVPLYIKPEAKEATV